MPKKWEFKDDGWTVPVHMPVHEFAVIDGIIDLLGEQDVYISTTCTRHGLGDDAFEHLGGVASMEVVEVSLCPESPGAMEQLDRMLGYIEKGSLN